MNEDQNTKEFIEELCRQVAGVGATKAAGVAGDFQSFLDFRDGQAARFASIQKTNGSRFLTDEQVSDLISKRQPFAACASIIDAWVMLLARDFVASQGEMVQNIHLTSLDINPLLALALEFTHPRQLLQFNLYQTVTRSAVTAWGSVIQEMLVRVGAEQFQDPNAAQRGNRPDIKKISGGVEYLIQVKSGPNTMNVSMIQSLNQAIAYYEAANPSRRVILGMTYGTRGSISPQIMGGLVDAVSRTKIGRELWDFITDETNFHQKLIALLNGASVGLLPVRFSELVERQLDRLVDEWGVAYGNVPLAQALENYL